MILTPTKGQLLIAEPSVLGDVSFNRSVILLANHSNEGSVGFILNKPLDVTLCDLIEGVDSCDIPIYNGGPVEQDNIYFIHTVPDLLKGSQEISDGIYWGGDFEKAIDLILNKKISTDSIKFFLGYSGWAKNQLEGELQEHTWAVQKNTSHHELLKLDDHVCWKNKIMELGGSYPIWSNAPENPQYN